MWGRIRRPPRRILSVVSDGSVTSDDSKTLLVTGSAKDEPPPLGATVSRYVVLEEVGRGGMGRVLRAYDPKLQREVAIKQLRLGTGDAEATTRMVAEARAMARLSHPNVVSVYDVEELDEAQVVIAMEFVAGMTLKAWLREDAQPWETIVSRFIHAGRGLAAAHEAELLHRDFKPANVLVTEGAVKVTDFGIAKALGAGPDSISLDTDAPSLDDLTSTGTVVGTPRYMAPEQHASEPLDAAADQYAFCVALWEALCGAPPFAGKTLVKDKLAGPPPWPNKTTPASIAQAIIRGLSPQPERRWPSMQALLSELQLDPSGKRNRWLIATAAIGVSSLAAASYLASRDEAQQPCTGAEQQLAGIWDTDRAEAVERAFADVGRSYVEGAWSRTKATLDAYARAWVAAHTEACEASTVRREQSPQMMDLRMACLHRAVVEMRATVDVLADADSDVVQNADTLTDGLRPLSRCGDIEALTADVEPPSDAEAEAVEAARAALAKSKSLRQAGRYDASKKAVEAARSVLADATYGPVLAELSLADGDILDELGRYAEAETALEEAVRVGTRWKQQDTVRRAAVRLMGLLAEHQKRPAEALRYAPLADGLSQGDPLARAGYRNNMAGILVIQADYAAAEAEHRAVLALRQETLGPEHPDVAASRHNVANALYNQGRYEEAEAEHRAALALRESILGSDHPRLATSRSNLAGVLFAQGKVAEAEQECRKALDVRVNALGPEHPNVAGLHNNLAMILATQGKHEEAAAQHRSALALKAASLGPDHPSNAISHNNLATVLFALKEFDEAETEHRAALALWEKSLGPEHPRVAVSRSNLAAVLMELHRPDEALPLLESSWKVFEADPARPPDERAALLFTLAQALWQAEEPARDQSRARGLALQARDLYAEAGESTGDAEDVDAWLDARRENTPIKSGVR